MRYLWLINFAAFVLLSFVAVVDLVAGNYGWFAIGAGFAVINLYYVGKGVNESNDSY